MAVPIFDDDKTDTTVRLEDIYTEINEAYDGDGTDQSIATEVKATSDINSPTNTKTTKCHGSIVFYTAIVCVMTVLKQWIQDELEDNRSKKMVEKDLYIPDKGLSISLPFTMKEYFKTKEFAQEFVKTFHYIPRQVLEIFMLDSQEFNKYINGKTDLPSLMKDSMQFEWKRLSSFANYPNSSISVIRLAEAGFFYQGKSDEVVCFFCNFKHNNWTTRDNPSSIHKEHSPNCPFVIKSLNSKRPKLEDTVKPISEVEIATGSVGACGWQSDIAVTPKTLSNRKLNNTSSNDEQNEENTTNTSTEAQTEQILPAANVNRGEDEHFSNSKANQDIEHNKTPATVSAIQSTNAHNIGFNLATNEAGTPTSEANTPRLEQRRSTASQNNEMILSQGNPEGTFHNFSRNDTIGLIPIQNFGTAPQNSNKQGQHTPFIGFTTNSNPDNMGVCVEKPKYPKYAVKATRLSSFSIWPPDLTQRPEELATAGFFYTGKEDHCRCFFCGGGLRRWEDGDVPWTEHARWYPKCPFVIQCKGQKFIDDVQNGRSTENAELGNTASHLQNHVINGFTNNPAVQTILEFGYELGMVKTAYTNLRHAGIEDITATLLLETLYEMVDDNQTSERSILQGDQNSTKKTETVSSQIPNNIGNEDKKENEDPLLELSIRSLEEENRNLKDQQTCKICLDEPVAIVFLPCGHMAACINCAPALRRCPICRAFIKGTVKAIMC